MTEAQGILRHYADKMFHPHPLSELRKLREAGKAAPIAGFNFAYDEVEPKAPVDLDSTPDEEPQTEPDPDPQTYATRDMTATPRTRKPRTQRYKPTVKPAEERRP